ncbi:MAG: hypothetical protein AAGA40_03095 [Cyanobacteria bacterium P01_E01_bin.45]
MERSVLSAGLLQSRCHGMTPLQQARAIDDLTLPYSEVKNSVIKTVLIRKGFAAIAS